MSRLVILAVLLLGLSAPAVAQHADHVMPPPTMAHDHEAQSADAAPLSEEHTIDDFVPPPAPGDGDAPDAPLDHAADAFFPKADMVRARDVLDKEHGGALHSKIMANLLEYQSRSGEGGYRWEGEGWFGGDLNRLVVKSEGEGSAANLQNGEAQALYSRAIGPYTDLQIGVRQNFEPGPSRTYLALGLEALLPYQFEAMGALFVGQRGQVLGRLDGTYDFMLIQRLVLQPRVELNFAYRNDAASGTGAGLYDAELGLRLRYEIRREFAPYIGISVERSYGDTADFARIAGERVEKVSFVAGIRTWF